MSIWKIKQGTQEGTLGWDMRLFDDIYGFKPVIDRNLSDMSLQCLIKLELLNKTYYKASQVNQPPHLYVNKSRTAFNAPEFVSWKTKTLWIPNILTNLEEK